MRILLTFLILSLVSACSEQLAISKKAEEEITPPVLAVSMYDSPLINPSIALNNPYDLNFRLEKSENGEQQIAISIKLNGGSFFVSPHSTRDFKGKFTVQLADFKELKLGSFVEIPRSKEVSDPHHFVDGPVNWVQADTRYLYELNQFSDEDFDVGGKIFFTIEPKCTLEEIPFIIKNRSGILRIEPWEC